MIDRVEVSGASVQGLKVQDWGVEVSAVVRLWLEKSRFHVQGFSGRFGASATGFLRMLPRASKKLGQQWDYTTTAATTPCPLTGVVLGRRHVRLRPYMFNTNSMNVMNVKPKP